MKKHFSLLFLVIIPMLVSAQNTGIGTTTPADKLEVKNPVRSAVRISGNSFNDTSQLILSNRNASQQGTDFILSSNAEQGLRLSSASDIVNNRHDSIIMIMPNGRVGINNINPAQQLDVRGNVNVDGTILANGVDGTAGQVLMKNTGGNLAWGNMASTSNFANTIGFNAGFSTFSPTDYNWTVPAGVTKLLVECWGGGGGGAAGGGGGGGGYAASEWTVTPGASVAISVAASGPGASTPTGAGGTGGSSYVEINLVRLIALGGQGAGPNNGGFGGRFYTTGALRLWGQGGEAGSATSENYGQLNATTYMTSINFGNGGRCGNTVITNNNGGYRTVNSGTGTTVKTVFGSTGTEPGGGGGGDSLNSGGANYGGPGLVIIHY